MPAPIEVTQCVRYCAADGCNEIMNVKAHQERCAYHAAENIRIIRNIREGHISCKGAGIEMSCARCGVTVIRNNWQQKRCKPCARLVNNESEKKNGKKPTKVVRQPAPVVAPVPHHLVFVIPRNTARAEREALRMDALVTASRLPGYDPRHPERFIVYQEATA